MTMMHKMDNIMLGDAASSPTSTNDQGKTTTSSISTATQGSKPSAPPGLNFDDPPSSPFPSRMRSASATSSVGPVVAATDGDSVASGLSADAPVFPPIGRAASNNSVVYSSGGSDLLVHNSSAVSSGGVPKYLNSSPGYITPSNFNVGHGPSGTSTNSNFHRFSSSATNTASVSPDLWSQQYHHNMNPAAASFKLNSLSPNVRPWSGSMSGGGAVPQDDPSYRRPEDGMEKVDSFPYHYETRDSTNTTVAGQAPMPVQRQYHNMGNAHPAYPASTTYPTKGYGGGKASPSPFMMYQPPPQHHMQQQHQQQVPLYSRTSSYGNNASGGGAAMNASNAGPAASPSPQFGYGSTPPASPFLHTSKEEDVAIGDYFMPAGGDRVFGHGGRNPSGGQGGMYNPYAMEGVPSRQQQQQFPSPYPNQFGSSGVGLYGQQQVHPPAPGFEYGGEGGRFMDVTGQDMRGTASPGNRSTGGFSGTSSATSTTATAKIVQEIPANNKFPWGYYYPTQGLQDDTGVISEGSTEASSSVFSSADASGLDTLWRSCSGSGNQGAAGGAIRGGSASDLSLGQGHSANLHSASNLRSFGDSRGNSASGGGSGALGQLMSTSPSYSPANHYQVQSQSSLQVALMEEQKLGPQQGTEGDAQNKEDENASSQGSLLLENPLPPLVSLDGLVSPVGGRGRQQEGVGSKVQIKKDYGATVVSGSAKKNNRASKSTKNQKSSSKLTRKNSSSSAASATGSASSMAPAFRGSTSSLAVAASMLPHNSSFASYTGNEEDLGISSLGLKDNSMSPPFPAMGEASQHQQYNPRSAMDRPILPSSAGNKKFYPSSPTFPDSQMSTQSPYTAFLEEGSQSFDYNEFDYGANTGDDSSLGLPPSAFGVPSNATKKRDWLVRMNRKLKETDVGALDPSRIPIHAVMNAWAKTKSSEGAQMVEMWLRRVEKEVELGNTTVEIGTKMYTMAVDAWAKSGEKGAATRAEGILQHMNQMYQNGSVNLKPTTGIFNAVINAWARSGEKIAPLRAEQILEWMDKLNKSGNPDIKPDKYSYNTVIHAWAKSGGNQAAFKAQTLLTNMEKMYNEGNSDTKPDTITYNVVINAWAKSGGGDAALEAEKLLLKMHKLYDTGNLDVKPNVVTYGAVIDSWAKSGNEGAAARADSILANMIRIHQSDPIQNADLRPNTYVFNTVINAWAKSKQPDAASKAEEMLVAMGQLHACGIPGLKPDAFTYTAVIDAWAKSGYRGAATRADRLLEKMEAEYQSGDNDLKPNTFTYNAVINALAKSGEPGAAARAERVLHNMVKRHKSGNDDVKPTTINFNTVLDAFAKSGGKGAAERAEEILEWMDRLNKSGNMDVKPDTITFNAVIDAWARSGDRRAPSRAEQILEHMDELYKSGNNDVQPDTYTYNTVINAWAKSGEKGSASRAEHILAVMEKRCREGDHHLKPNTRTHTSVIDAWAKSGERGAAARAEHILNSMQIQYEEGNLDVKPNSHTYNAVMNACAFTKHEEDRDEALTIAFRVFERLSAQKGMHPDAYTYTILLSVCANLLPKDHEERRFAHAKALFEKCCEAGYVNDYVLRKLRQTVTEREYIYFVGSVEQSADRLPRHWTRNALKGGRGNQWVGNNKGKRK